MKKLLLALFLCSLFCTPALQAQNTERLESLKIAYITRQVDLTPAEAEKFWPIYNKYQDEIRSNTRESRQKGESELELEERLLNVRKKYKNDFTRVISEEKFDKFMKAEKGWGEMVRKEIQRRKEGGEAPPGKKKQIDNIQ